MIIWYFSTFRVREVFMEFIGHYFGGKNQIYRFINFL